MRSHLNVRLRQASTYLRSLYTFLTASDIILFSVRVPLTPLQDLVGAFDIQVTEIGEPHYDDPSLALLFSQLRSKTLQAATGTSEISGKSEFNFVLQIARVFSRMGYQVLALDLSVRSWTFDMPTPVRRREDAPPSPTISRRPTQCALGGTRRRSSMIIDMDIPSLPPTRAVSPPPVIPEERLEDSNGKVSVNGVAQDGKEKNERELKNEGDFLARKAGLGNLMKSAKQDVEVPEFDMDAFF